MNPNQIWHISLMPKCSFLYPIQSIPIFTGNHCSDFFLLQMSFLFILALNVNRVMQYLL